VFASLVADSVFQLLRLSISFSAGFAGATRSGRAAGCSGLPASLADPAFRWL